MTVPRRRVAPFSCVEFNRRMSAVAKTRAQSRRVDQFENMSDEELRQYVYVNKELDS